MADLLLTEGADTYVHAQGAQWQTIRSLGGDDRVTIHANATVEAGAGNDVVANIVNGGWHGGGIAYWRSPQAIFADLEAGFVEDGYGNRDTVINFRHLLTPGRNGDKVLGTSFNDDLMLNGFNRERPSTETAFVDLRGGYDVCNFWEVDFRSMSLNVSVDGRSVIASYNNYTATIKNVEALQFNVYNPSTGRHEPARYEIKDLIDFNKVGAQTLLLPNQRGWGSEVSFSFMAAAPAYGGADGGSGFIAPTADYQNAVRSILGKLGTQIGLNFVEVADSAGSFGQLRFGANQQSATKGYSFIPGTVPDARAGDVWLDAETLAVLQPGQEGWQVLLHEIGHALGLSHPIAEGSATEATTLLNAWNDNRYTVMSPNQVSSGLWQSWYGPLDIQALKQLYGSRSGSSAPGDDTYRMSDSQGFGLAAMSDSAGIDTFDASSLSLGAYINLTPGSFSSVGYTQRGTASVDNLYLDPGTVIENARGTAYDDVLLGNASDNLFWPGAGNDWVDGKGGFNVAMYDVPRSGYWLYRLDDGTGAWAMNDMVASSGSDTLINVQRVRFNDVRVALDIDGNAGQAARIAATVYGVNGLRDPQAVGGILRQLDSGVAVSTVYANELASPRFTQLAGGSDAMAYVKQMFRNLVNIEATDAMARPYIEQYLDTGAYTRASLAQSVSSLAQVDMVGLAKSGVDYIY